MRRCISLFCLLALVLPAGGAARAASEDLTTLVDPFIGTLGSGFVFPGPAAPYGMVQLSPDTEGPFAYTGYQWSDRNIRGFSHVHTQSMGVREGGEIPFMPTTGAIETDVTRYESPYAHAREEASPGYYAVDLLRYGVRAELTAGTRVGVHRYTFPPLQEANVLIDVGRNVGEIAVGPGSMPGGAIPGELHIDAATQTVTGHATSDDYTVYFASRFNRPFSAFGTWPSKNAAPNPATADVMGSGAGGYVSFDVPDGGEVLAKVGISYVSVANAVGNLESEMPGDDFGFDAVRARTRSAWNDALSSIVVDGGTDAERKAFYTSLYHAQHHPNTFDDANGDYRGYDQQVHNTGGTFTYYANYSFWDTYRAEMPLLMLIAPDRVRDMMRSLAKIVEQGGRLPRWGWMARYADFMNGEPGVQVFADAFCRGLVPSDVLETLYGAARTWTTQTRRNPDYLTRGWVTNPSTTMEHAIADFSLALVADRLGRADDTAALMQLQDNWRNVFDTSIGFVRPRNADGSWKSPYVPEDSEGFTEGTGWQYSWLVPHDPKGLFEAMGGEEAARGKLDQFFSAALAAPLVAGPEVQQKLTAYGITYYGNQYAPSNEHDLQAPWLYNWTSEPWKTQHLVRAYQSIYRATPDGLPGNDDLGTMSAWFVWSALGMYPVTPGSPTYAVGSPLFERATIRGGATIDAPLASQAVRFVDGVRVNGTPSDRLTLTHDEIARPGTIAFTMSPAPSSWGTVQPPSQTTTALADFGCSG